MEKKLTEFEVVDSPNIIIRVTDSSEDYDYSAEFAVISINPTRKAFFLDLRERLRAIKQVAESAYDIRVWDYSPKLISPGVVDEIASDELSHKIGQKDLVQVNNELFNELQGDSVERCSMDVVLLQVSEEGVFWTGVYKSTTIEFSTEKIPFSLIEKL